MRTRTELILRREDLIFRAKDAPFEYINYYMFKCSINRIINTDKIIFEDNDGRTKILKNRYDE